MSIILQSGGEGNTAYWLDGNLIFQVDDIMSEKELERIFKKQHKISYPERPSLVEDIFAGDDSFDY